MTKRNDVAVKANDERLPAIVERLKDRKTNLLEESRALGFSHNGPLRRALRELLGKDAFAALALAVRAKGRSKIKRCNPVPASREGSSQ
jgi:hypothetical protein